jgi:aldehyde dehydrogenase (NAD+)
MTSLTLAEVGAPAFLLSGPQYDMPVEGVAWVADVAESYAWERDAGTAQPMGVPTRRTVRREPTGVVAAITPWNFPTQLNLSKVGPALAAGNTVVLKSAPDTPWVAAELARLAAERTDLPPGVLNVVSTSDDTVAARLTADERVDLVSFTGSTATGRKVMAAGAPTIKRVFLELGGKSAAVVLDDADLAAAVGSAAFSVCVHAGQGCALTTRLLVPRERYDEAVDIAAATMSGIGVCDPADEGTICGPVISPAQVERIAGYVDLAREEGGTIACGGRVPPDRDRGYWYEPTVIAGLDNTARVAREEIFGPVLTVIAHDGDDDAVRIANDSPYGLSGSVDAADEQRAQAVARRIRTGSLTVNGGVWYSPGRSVRWLQAVRARPRDGRRGLRGVPRDQAHRRAGGACRIRGVDVSARTPGVGLAVGFVGLGAIGKPMALRLADAEELTLHVFDVAPEPLEELAATGAEVAADVADLATRADVICVMVRDDDQVRDVVGQVLEVARPGTIVAVHSTVAPDTPAQLADLAASHEVAVIEATAGRPTSVSPRRPSWSPTSPTSPGPCPASSRTRSSAAAAYVAYHNASEGPIYGRQLQLPAAGLAAGLRPEPAAVPAGVRRGVRRGRLHVGLRGGCRRPGRGCGIPDLRAVATSRPMQQVDNVYSTQVQVTGQVVGADYRFWAEEYPEAMKNAGYLYLENETTAVPDEQNRAATETARLPSGTTCSPSRSPRPTTTGSSSSSRNATSAISRSWGLQPGVRLAKAMRQQNYWPEVFSLQTNIYKPEFLQSGGEAIEGTQIGVTTALLEEIDQQRGDAALPRVAAAGRPVGRADQPRHARVVGDEAVRRGAQGDRSPTHPRGDARVPLRRAGLGRRGPAPAAAHRTEGVSSCINIVEVSGGAFQRSSRPTRLPLRRPLRWLTPGRDRRSGGARPWSAVLSRRAPRPPSPSPRRRPGSSRRTAAGDVGGVLDAAREPPGVARPGVGVLVHRPDVDDLGPLLSGRRCG